MLPTRRRIATFYDFSLTSSGRRAFRWQDLELQKKPYEVDSVQMEIYSLKSFAVIKIQGKILNTEIRAQTLRELEQYAKERCTPGACDARLYLLEEGTYGQDWLYKCDFCLYMGSAVMLRPRGKKFSQDEMVWETYQRIAQDMDFLGVRPFLHISHRFMHLVDHHWRHEDEMFLDGKSFTSNALLR